MPWCTITVLELSDALSRGLELSKGTGRISGKVNGLACEIEIILDTPAFGVLFAVADDKLVDGGPVGVKAVVTEGVVSITDARFPSTFMRVCCFICCQPFFPDEVAEVERSCKGTKYNFRRA